MQTDQDLPDSDVKIPKEYEQEQRMESSMEALDVSIARLAIILGVPLNTDADIQRAMQEPQNNPALAGMEARLAQKHAELRALLIMRYDMEKRFSDEVGSQNTRQIMEEAAQHLNQRGFRPGADGVDLGDGKKV